MKRDIHVKLNPVLPLQYQHSTGRISSQEDLG